MNKKSQFILPFFLLFVITFAYLVFFICLSFARHEGLKSYLNDLGHVDQPIYNTTQGRFMKSSDCEGCNGVQLVRFAGHANFVLLAFIPFYFVLPDPKILLFAQTLLISLGALPLYWLGKRVFNKSGWLPLVVPFLYLTSPMVQDVNLYDFHAIAVAMPLIIFAFYFMYIIKYRLFAVFAVLISLCNEDMPLIIFMMGLYMVFFQKEYKKGLVTSLLSFSYFAVLVSVIMPWFSRGIAINPVTYRYSYLGKGVWEIAANILLKPWVLGRNILTPDRIVYIVTLVAPVLFFPLMSIDILFLSLPSLLINVLSENPAMHNSFFFYYSAPILAFIFLSTIFSLSRLRGRVSISAFPFLIMGLISASVLFSVNYSPAPYSQRAGISDYKVSDHAKRIGDIKKLIPQNVSLSIQNNLGAHFSHREKIYTFPDKSDVSDFVVVDINDPYVGIPREGPDFVFITQLTIDGYFNKVSSLFANSAYGVFYFSDDGYLVFKKGYKRDENGAAEEMFEKNFEAISTRYKMI